MKKTFSFGILAILTASCSLTEEAPKRAPANHLPEEQSHVKELKIFTGPGLMQAEYPIATSHKNAPLEVVISSLPGAVECKLGEMGRFTKELRYTLAPYRSGSGETVYCRNPYDGRSDYPSYEKVEITQTIQNRTKSLPFTESAPYKAYSSMVDELEDLEPSDDLLSFTEDRMSAAVHKLDYENEFQFEYEVNSHAVEISAFTGQVKFDEGWFRSSESTPVGIEADEKKRETLTHPERPAYELVCSLGDRVVRASEFEKIFIFDFSGKVQCHVNLYHKYAKKKHKGSYEVEVKQVSHDAILAALESDLDVEGEVHKNNIERMWKEDIVDFTHGISKVQQNQSQAQSAFADRVKQIDRQKFETKRDRVVNTLFPKEVKGAIGRGVSIFTLTPVQKKYFLPDGKVKSKTYLSLKGSTYGLFKSSEFSFDFAYTPFGEDYSVYLYAEDVWKDGLDPIEMKVCLADKKNFYQELFSLQKTGNTQKLYMQDYLDRLGAYQVAGVDKCVVFDGEEFSLSRKDEYFWIGQDDDTAVTVDAFGAAYEGSFNEVTLRHTFEQIGPHPFKGKQVPKNAVSGKKEGSRFVIERSLDAFVMEP